MLFPKLSVCQDTIIRSLSPIVYSHADTIKVKGDNFHNIIYYNHMSEDIFKEKIFNRYSDEIFCDSFNDFSRLVINGYNSTIEIPTIPLTHIYILISKNIIVGLSQYTVSPYNIVLYSMEGKLLYKSKISIFEFKLKKEELKRLVTTYPDIRYCFEQNRNAFKDGEYYYLEFTNCLINKTGNRDSVLAIKEVISNHYFPRIAIPTNTLTATGKYRYREYAGFIDNSDPFYDLIMIGTVPYLLILNDADGKKVEIPLVPNCDILKEIEEW